MYQGICREIFLFRPPPEQLPSKVIVKQFRLVGDAEEPGSLLSCAAVFLHDPAEVACLISWPESRDADFTLTYLWDMDMQELMLDILLQIWGKKDFDVQE